MGVKIKKGKMPRDCAFSITGWKDGIRIPFQYTVIRVTGTETNVPTFDATVFLKISGRPGGSPPTFVSLPLTDFVEECVSHDGLICPLSEEDVFWEITKTPA